MRRKSKWSGLAGREHLLIDSGLKAGRNARAAKGQRRVGTTGWWKKGWIWEDECGSRKTNVMKKV